LKAAQTLLEGSAKSRRISFLLLLLLLYSSAVLVRKLKHSKPGPSTTLNPTQRTIENKIEKALI
jgi:hypothetical protein